MRGCVEHVLRAVPAGSAACFYRTAAGAEIDLVVDLQPTGRWALEIKRSVRHPEPARGFHMAVRLCSTPRLRGFSLFNPQLQAERPQDCGHQHRLVTLRQRGVDVFGRIGRVS